jgi:hypothetical protein
VIGYVYISLEREKGIGVGNFGVSGHAMLGRCIKTT